MIAALCCAAFFVIVGLVVKFRWRPSDADKEIRVSYKKRDSDVSFSAAPGSSKLGQENMAMDKFE